MPFSFRDYTESDEVKRRRQQAQQYETYNEAQAVIDARNALQQHESNRVSPWTGGTYGQALQNAVDRIQNREKFSYDLNGDALYKQYKDQYMNLGRTAMMDTMGQAAAMTGGYGNSYAATAGNQAYQGYLQQLNNVVPELYQMALDRYDREGQDMYNQANLLGSMYGTEYGEYRDRVADWNTEAARLADRYNNERNFDWNTFSSNRDYYTNAYNTERQWDYGLYSDDYSRGFANYQQGVAESQFAQEMALKQAQLAEQIRANKANEAYRAAQAAARNSGGGGSAGAASTGGSSGATITSRSGIKVNGNSSQDAILAYIASERQYGASNNQLEYELKSVGVNPKDVEDYVRKSWKYNIRTPY